MAVTITLRNAPGDAADISAAAGQDAASRSHARSFSADLTDHSAPHAKAVRRSASPRNSGDYFSVGIPATWLSSLPAAEQAELKQQARLVENQAREQLERMTGELDLSTAQRRKIFPMLVRSTPGYDPAMQVAGGALDPAAASAVDEEVHDVLDSEQKAQLEDEVVNRQLWWQDIFTRLEKDLVESTGGAPTQPESTAEEDPAPADPGQSPPPAHPGGNLLDLVE